MTTQREIFEQIALWQGLMESPAWERLVAIMRKAQEAREGEALEAAREGKPTIANARTIEAGSLMEFDEQARRELLGLKQKLDLESSDG